MSSMGVKSAGCFEKGLACVRSHENTAYGIPDSVSSARLGMNGTTRSTSKES